jgi:membrane protease subunit HflK
LPPSHKTSHNTRGTGTLKAAFLFMVNAPKSSILLAALPLAAIAAAYAVTFRVNPDELGVVVRLGTPARLEAPGLHLRLPYPIEEVHLPKVTRQNVVEIGPRSGAGNRNVRDEGLRLTGDENIVAASFIVFWRIKDVQQYLFNVQNPDNTVREVADSAMQEVVGQSRLQPILTEMRQQTEQAVQARMQQVLDAYRAGVRIDLVQLQKVDPPAQVIDAFRDVQAARADEQRLHNEAFAYASRVVAEARGEAERILLNARAYREQAVAEATGQTSRFLKVYEEYRKAPEVTRKRMHLETIERALGGADKVIVDRGHLAPQPENREQAAQPGDGQLP